MVLIGKSCIERFLQKVTSASLKSSCFCNLLHRCTCCLLQKASCTALCCQEHKVMYSSDHCARRHHCVHHLSWVCQKEIWNRRISNPLEGLWQHDEVNTWQQPHQSLQISHVSHCPAHNMSPHYCMPDEWLMIQLSCMPAKAATCKHHRLIQPAAEVGMLLLTSS